MGKGSPSGERNTVLSPVSLMFSVGNIDEDELRQYIKERPGQFQSKWDAAQVTLQLRELGNWESAVKEGELPDFQPETKIH